MKSDCRQRNPQGKTVFRFTQIAHIETGFIEKFGIPRQSGLATDATGRIVFEPEFRHPDAVKGIEEYDYLWLLFIFSENVREKWNATVTPPKLGGKERRGVFATRSPFRPNPIGLSCVRLEKIVTDEKCGQTIIVSGADLLNGTPIVDIKPYIPYADAHPGVRGGFGESLSDMKFDVVFPDEMKELLPTEYRNAVVQILEQDPRPAFIHDEERVWGVFYYDYNIRFKVRNGVITVCGVDKKAEY